MSCLYHIPLLKIASNNSNILVTVIDFKMAFSGLKDDPIEVYKKLKSLPNI